MEPRTSTRPAPPAPLKVLFLPSWYPNRTNPTAGNFIQQHALAVSCYASVAVLFVCPDKNIREQTYELHTATEQDIFTVRVYYRKVQNPVPGLAQLIKAWRYMQAVRIGWQAVEKLWGRPHLHHVHVIFKNGLIGWWLKRKQDIPYIVSEHWTGYQAAREGFKGMQRRWVTRRVVQHTARATTVSADLRDAMLRHGLQNQYDVVPNVTNTDLFKPPERKRIRPVKRLIHVSTLRDAHKNISGIFRVLQRLRAERTDFVLDIIDDGFYTEYFREKAGAMGIEKHVRFHGRQTPEGVARRMQLADCFVLFSNYETFGVVLIEALACGVPVIATRVGGVPEFIDDTKGILIPPRDEDALLNAIRKMLDKHQEFKPKALHDFVHRKYSYDSVGKQFMEVYRRVLGR